MAPQRKRKVAQACSVLKTLFIGNCIVEFPSDADQEYIADKLCLQLHHPASITISVDNQKPQAFEKPNPVLLEQVLPQGPLFQVINPKSPDSADYSLLEIATMLYKKELPAMSFAAGTGKESDFLRNCTTSGKYCTLLMKKPGVFPADTEVIVGAITYQILPTNTQYAEIPLAAVDQIYQRQGFGKLLVKELARRLADVGVLTLFCWGDQESGHFWNKMGFVKIAAVDPQGKPQKLRLKNEIRKAMSLPGNSALMVCNLHAASADAMPVSFGEITPHRNSDKINANHMIETETKTKTASDRTQMEVQQSPIACSEVSDPYSLGDTLPKVPLSSDVTSQQAASLPCSSEFNSAECQVKSYSKGSSCKVSVMTDHVSDCKFSSLKFSRTLRFTGCDIVEASEKGTCENTPVLPSDKLAVTQEHKSPGFIFVNPTTETNEKILSTSPSNPVLHRNDKLREPLRNVENTSAYNSVPLAQHQSSDATPEVCLDQENDDLVKEKVLETEPPKSRLKRPRAKPLTSKKIGRKSVRRESSDSPTRIDPVLEMPEPSASEPTLSSSPVKKAVRQSMRRQSGGDPARVNPVIETLQASAPKPSSNPPPAKKAARQSVRRQSNGIPGGVNPVNGLPEPSVRQSSSEQLSAAQNTEIVNDCSGLNHESVSDTRDARSVDCLRSATDDCVTPVGADDRRLKSTSKKQDKDVTIRKRLSSRPVNIPEVRVGLPLALGYAKDSATCSTPVVFLANMPNDPKKRALIQLVEKLGGKVTSDGGQCTHVIASEVRRTLNFCTALCRGAWVVTPEWLKSSNKHKSFVDEKEYLLRDKEYESKYKAPLTNAIQIAQHKSCSLFAGFYIYPTPHVQPPLDTIVKLSEAAGGKVLKSLDEALQQNYVSHSIVLGGEEDKSEVENAAKAGLRTFTGEWFMQAIVKQKIDLDTNILQ
uniref:BRCT domain-containing protein n=1 Tax=Physcomitrium patens TaxID=3218 RepID=A0A7I4DL10_PHYPA|nr:uncharacterized protein LOC112281876 isoform X2 [Physcomitrium patens]|eukprot:XP_024374624.1 uncharacterized protein LOC112281876 isoform X2 [Physcomitrella patens]